MVRGYECRRHGGEESISLLRLWRKRGRASDPEDNSQLVVMGPEIWVVRHQKLVVVERHCPRLEKLQLQ
jgi:hypothetical protein